MSKYSGKLFITLRDTFSPATRISPTFVIVLIHLISAHQLNFPPMRGGARPRPGEIPHHFPLVRIPPELTDQSLNTIDRINEAGWKKVRFIVSKKVFRISIITPGDLAACRQEPGAEWVWPGPAHQTDGFFQAPVTFLFVSWQISEQRCQPGEVPRPRRFPG